MAKVNTTERLIELIEKSGLVRKQDFAQFIGQVAERRNGTLSGDPNELAAQIVESGLLSRWQIDQLLKGKYRGFRLGKYTLKDHLGTGGMSSVYLSEHPIMRRPVAIKVLPKKRVSKSSYLQRFELEARAVAALDHPNIVRAYDIDNEGDTHYIVMEYVTGKDFQRIVEQEGPMSYERAADYVAQAAVGLQHAHDAGVVHRDIKPANCLVDHSGVVKVLDMGLAKFATDEGSLSAVHKDSVVGTADYLAPEQAVNSSKVDARADVYGLGGTLYYLLTGHAPFPEGTLTERLLKHQREEPASIYADRPDAPATLVDVCRRMMIKRADERIQTAAEVANELQQWLAGRGYTGGDTPSKRIASALEQSSTTSRLGRLTATAPAPPRFPRTDRTSDTVSGATADTNDQDLTLAPLEDEELQGKRNAESGSNAGHDSSAGKSDVTDVTASDVNLDEAVLSRIEAELSGASSTSGSLVDLLEDKELSDVSTSGVVLRSSRNQGVPKWAIGLACGFGVLLAIALVAMVMSAINS